MGRGNQQKGHVVSVGPLREDLAEAATEVSKANLDLRCCVGIIAALGGCPLHILQRVLQFDSLYAACCWGGTNRQMRSHIVSLRLGVPVKPPLIQADPDLLITPVFRQFLSLL